MGQLRTRKRGSTWQYSFEAAPVDGKRRSISKGDFAQRPKLLPQVLRLSMNTTHPDKLSHLLK